MKLTQEEHKVLNDTHFLKVKHQLSEKVIKYLSHIERALHEEVTLHKKSFPFPKGTFLKGGKISKGDQYKLLPYFILDYPRLFTQKEIFAYRSMLWWGHHFSCTLQLSGPVLEKNKEVLIDNIFLDKDIYFCVNNQPWEYHYGNDNYLQIKDLTKKDLINQINRNGFIKVNDCLPLEEWEAYKSFTLKTFARFLQYFY